MTRCGCGGLMLDDSDQGSHCLMCGRGQPTRGPEPQEQRGASAGRASAKGAARAPHSESICRRTLELRESGKSIKEIAAAFSCSPRKVKNRLSNARRAGPVAQR